MESEELGFLCPETTKERLSPTHAGAEKLDGCYERRREHRSCPHHREEVRDWQSFTF